MEDILGLTLWELKGQSGSLDSCSKVSERERGWLATHSCSSADPPKPEYAPPRPTRSTPSWVLWAGPQRGSHTPHTSATGQGLEEVWFPRSPLSPNRNHTLIYSRYRGHLCGMPISWPPDGRTLSDILTTSSPGYSICSLRKGKNKDRRVTDPETMSLASLSILTSFQMPLWQFVLSLPRIFLFCVFPSCWRACMHAKPLHLCRTVTPWTVTCQAPLSMGFSRQEYWSRLCHALLQGIFPTLGSKLCLLSLLQLRVGSLPV